MRIATIVEGDGEVAALPILLRRIASWRSPMAHADVLPPIRVRRSRFVARDDEFRRYLLLATLKAGPAGWVLIVLDADDDCAVQLADQMLSRAGAVAGHPRLSVVLAVREYESWLIASAASLDGRRGFVHDPTRQVPAEVPRDAKGWIKAHMGGRGYSERMDQPAFTAVMDLSLAHANSRSFRKLCTEWDRYVTSP